MLTVGVTGSEGLLGWHLRCHLRATRPWRVVEARRDAFADPAALADLTAGCDAIVHLAGVNRGEDREVEDGNVALARALVEALERGGGTPHVLYASTIHAQRDTPYGRGKRVAGEILGEWADRVGAPYTCLVLPHVYGEAGRPFYNSVVSTFCHVLARGEEPEVIHDGSLELLHAQDLAGRVAERIASAAPGVERPEGAGMTVTELLARLREVSDLYRGHVFPRLSSDLDLRLFNTFRSYLYPSRFPVALPVHEDPRGRLFEGVKGGSGGQTFLSTSHPGVTRGGHFHLHKVERFLVVRGHARIRIRKLFSREVWEYEVSGDHPAYVDMPTLHTHDITNVGDGELMTLFWTHEIFDPERTDTYAEPVAAEGGAGR